MKFISKNITNVLEENYMPYVMSVIVSRAIPEIDGFKPAHRKLLYTMYTMKLLTGSRTKSANVVGQTMKLNPHGDGAIYATLVRLTKGYDALLHSFIDSKGNFGKYYSRDMKYAASRYTEVKLAQICSEIFKDIDKNTVEFVDNYDGKLKEPLLLPTTFPNVLVSNNKGIAVGMASNICSFNLKEVCDVTIQFLKNEEIDVLKYLKAPDFSSGGKLLFDEKQIRKIYNTGIGAFKLRSKYEYIKEDNCIEITEIPYTTTTEQIIDKIIDLIKSGKISGISDVRDETDLKGLKVTIDLKRGTDPELLTKKLLSMTTLEDTFACNFNILIGNAPRVMGIKEILREWIKFRITCIKNQIQHDIGKKSDKLHLLNGLAKVLLDIDKAIQIIRKTKNDESVIPNLMNAFEIDKIQAEYVANIRLRNLNEDYILNKVKEIEALKEELNELNVTFNDENKIKNIISAQLKNIKKQFGQERKTEIIEYVQEDKITQNNIVENYELKLFITKHQYIKKISMASLRGNSEHKLKDEDYIVQEIDAENHSEILFFTNKFNVYKMYAYDIADHKASSLGQYIPNLVDLDEGEHIIKVVATKDFIGHMVFAYQNGKIAKIPLSSYATKTNRKKLVKAYSDDSSLIRVFYMPEDEDIILFRDEGSKDTRVMLINTSVINEKTTRTTRGIQCMRMKKNSIITSVKKPNEIEFNDVEYYRFNSIPRAGNTYSVEDSFSYFNKK
ncbi:DNA topoisomerase (ATP-hydrolyzing) subunit A [Clostridiaceae bacterium M8S5]|nr:DNA topoisomerase (ATP-hydrolyzing) subunit A [Clostridiaceae bacterium M8S5]